MYQYWSAQINVSTLIGFRNKKKIFQKHFNSYAIEITASRDLTVIETHYWRYYTGSFGKKLMKLTLSYTKYYAPIKIQLFKIKSQALILDLMHKTRIIRKHLKQFLATFSSYQRVIELISNGNFAQKL